MDVSPVGVWSCFLNLFLFGIKVVGGVLGGNGGGIFCYVAVFGSFFGGCGEVQRAFGPNCSIRSMKRGLSTVSVRILHRCHGTGSIGRIIFRLAGCCISILYFVGGSSASVRFVLSPTSPIE